MKIYSIIVLSVILVVALLISGCSSPAPTQAPSPTQASPAAQTSAPAPSSVPAPASTTAAPPAKVIEMKIGTFGSMQSSGVTLMLEPFAKSIEEASGGRVKFTIYAGTLVKQAELADAVEKGLCDIALITPDITPGRFPRTEINVLPGMYTSAAAGGSALHKTLEKYTFDNEWNKVKVLFVQSFPPMAIASTKPIQTIENMKGMKIGAEGTVETWFVESLGGTAVRFSLPEVYSMLERGLIDAIDFSWEAIMIFGVKDVTKYHVNAQTLNRGFVCAMNLDSWNKLPPDIQAVFEKNIGIERSRAVGEAMDGLMANFKKGLADYNAKAGNPPIVEFSPEEAAKWNAVYTQIQDRWVSEKEKANLPARAMLDDFKKFLAEYSK